MQFVNSSGQVVPEWGYIIGPYLADYEDRSDPANVVSEKHFCASLITQNSNTGIWERSRIVYNKSSDNFATATTPINITEDSDYMTQGCYMDVEKINGEKVIAVSAVGRGCSECSGYRSVLFKKNLRTESFDRGPEIGYITQEQVESGAYSYTRIELASDGGVHAFYMANYDLYYKKCTMTSCSDPVLVASDIATQLENDFNAFSFIKYDEVLYVAYATDDDGNGLTDVMLKTLPENSLTFSSEIKISSADAVKGSAKGVAVDVYRAYVDDQRIAEELIEEELIARELIVVIAYTYETENKAYISVSVGNTIDFGNEEEFAGPTDSSETGGVMAAAALISELGYVSVSFLIAGVGHDYRDVKYRPMEIVSDPDNSGKYTVDFGGRTAIPYSRTVIEHSSGFTSSRVGRTAVLYCKSEHISDAEGYDVDGVGIEISRVKGSQ
jgi:hypothetical protein